MAQQKERDMSTYAGLFHSHMDKIARIQHLERQVAELEAENRDLRSTGHMRAPAGSDHALLEYIARRVAGPRTTSLHRPDGSKLSITTHGAGRGGHMTETDTQGATTRHGTVTTGAG
ncbi:MAG TPA: bZIP transcription factor [Steroidobacteraceae bacterium]|nr:bZIP transcription factor [Steroidobacteraceae bacterium]